MEHESDMVAAEEGQLVFVKRAEVVLINLDAAGNEAVETADKIEKRRFPRPGGAEEADEFPLFDTEVDPA